MIGIIISICALALTMFGYGFAMIWWASRMTTKIEHSHDCIHRIEKINSDLSKEVKALFSKHDDLKTRVAVLESKQEALK